ncbi:MAG: hypothetical protein ABI581_05440, partial [Sediminibacterium sp.]
MTDLTRKYLTENYDLLSPEGPGENVWRNISRGVPEKKGKIFFIGLKKLAAACAIIVIGISAYFFSASDRKQIKDKTSVGLIKSTKDKESVIPLIKKEYIERAGPSEMKESLAITNKKGQSKISADKPTPSIPVNMRIEQLAFQYESSMTRIIENQKTIISTTPVYGVPQDYFDRFIKDYYSLKLNENQIREKKRQSLDSVNALDILDEMIGSFQKKIALLKRLRTEIEKVNKANKQRQVGP